MKAMMATAAAVMSAAYRSALLEMLTVAREAVKN